MKPILSYSSRIVASVLFFVLAFSQNVWAQVNAYTFSQSAGTYTAITGGTTLTIADDYAYNGTTTGGSVPLSGTGFSIGFNFSYNGTTYDKFAINNNGWIMLGTGTFTIGVSSGNYTPLSTAGPSGLVSVISAFGVDLNGQTGSELRYQTIGTAPNRTLVVQWKNYNFYSGVSQNINFQIRLQETTNVISFIYGSNTTSTTTLYNPQVGIRGATSSDYINRNMSSNAAWLNNTTSGSSNTASCRYNNASSPASGTTFTYTPCTAQTPGIITPSAPGYTALEASWADPGQQNIMYVCPGTTVTFTQSGGSGSGDRYYWLADGTNGIVDWNIIPAEVKTSPFTQTFNSPGVYYLYHYPYNCTAFDYNQYARSIIFVESVYSSGYSADQSICYNSTPAQMQGGGVYSYFYTGIEYLWKQSTDNGVTWSNANGTNNQANYTSSSNLTQTTLYKRVTNLTQCSGNAQSQSEGREVTWAWTTGVAAVYPTADANDVFTWGESINKNSWSGVDGWGANAAAAISNETITNNGGYVEAIMQWNYRWAMMGLSNNNSNPDWPSIQYAIYPRGDGILEVYESGVSRGTFGSYVANDRLRVAVENNQVKYYKNSTLLYTSTVAPTLPLYVDVSIYSVNGGFKDLRIVNPIKVTVNPQLTPPTLTNISNP